MQTQENDNDVKVKEYINKYVKELQRHFEVPDKKMRFLIKEVYNDLAPANLINSLISMLKSFYNKNINIKIKRK